MGLSLLRLVLLGLAVSKAAASSLHHCKCGPTDWCWPSAHQWNALNQTVGGRLIASNPIGSPCHDVTETVAGNFQHGTYNEEACKAVRDKWSDPNLHDESTSSVMMPYFAKASCNPFDDRSKPCLLGDYVRYAINVTEKAHIQEGLKFVKKHNIRLVIRNTGHDFMGRSTGYGSLSLWTHHLKDLTLLPDYNAHGYKGPAIRVGAGVQGIEIYTYTHDRGYTVVGGECPSVGIAGGFTPGGGHSELSSLYGMGADQTLEWEVILADGTFTNVSPSNHADLYWALSGGGPGTYGIVWSMTIKAYKDIPVSGLHLSFTTPNIPAFWEFIDYYHTLTPHMTAHGAYSYAFYAKGGFRTAPLFAPLTPEKFLKEQWEAPLLAKLDSLGIKYTSKSYQFSNFLDAYRGLFPPFPVGGYQWGGRLISTDVVTKKPRELSAALREIAEGGYTLIEAAMSPNLKIAANVSDNAVLPAWRDTHLHLVPGIKWSDTGAWADQIKEQRRITEFVGPILKRLTPGGGSYMHEADPNDPDWKDAFYGKNYDRLRRIKRSVDRDDVFYAPTAVGSDAWQEDGKGRLCRPGHFNYVSDLLQKGKDFIEEVVLM